MAQRIAAKPDDVEVTDYRHLLDPELVDAALIMRETTARFTPMTYEKLQSRRAWMEQNAPAPRKDVSFERVLISRSDGSPDVPVYVVNAKSGARRPGILHMHGGGFTAATAYLGLTQLQNLAQTLNCTIVSVDYRLAPETTWQGSLSDNYAALRWLHRNTLPVGVDPQRIALMGESAGGGHAALLALQARDKGEVPIIFLCLTYPMLDDRAGTSRTLAPHIGYFGWNPEANRFGWESFLGQAPGGADVPAEAIPARHDDLAGLPPTWIGVGGLDLFVDEGIEFARRLNSAGVPSELLVVPGAFHGFDSFAPNAAVSQRFAAAKLAALKRGLGLS